MSEIGEALGTASEGGLWARVAGRKQGNAIPPDGEPGGECLNCGTALVGSFCQACGQKAHIHRSISGILHDLVHGVLHLDGKLWNTLPLLLFKPGRLTREYIEGKRARHVSPMAMFLFSVFLMFAVFQAVGLTTPSDISPEISGATHAEASRGLEAERDRLEKVIASLPADAPARSEAESDLKAVEDMIDGMTLGGRIRAGSPVQIDANITGIKSIDEGIVAKWRKNPTLMLYKLQSNSYKFSWLLIPLSIPFVWLLFLWRRQYKAYDHAIFVTYSLAFMSLLFITLSLLGTIDALGFGVFAALLVIPPIHLYKQLRGTYSLSRFSALWRLMALSLFIWIVVILFLQALLVLGAF
ncbi:DUF3667 domain-containing protein [Parerythrobacter lacustris]|uniref:DUF3667 domain-containing protein n=1 Tax=Parerythrobacter lacustris TaxID=2969984 RepID=A0ABT1XLS8_9SPHN|nr:DUF3667 domain-containing protein [Parerythrobacter lacustris]MCR2832618.1 DUF3667 domain-containing protein [Parerythrobacter lacustris]